MTERRYHHGNLAAVLVEAGLELTRDGGPEALGLREVTRRVGVTPNAAYRHFADRRALLDAVGMRVQELMAERMAVPVETTGDAAEQATARLQAVGMGYIEFALAEPGWFALAFFPARGAPELHSGQTTSASGPRPDGLDVAPPYRMLVTALDALLKAGVLTPEARAGAEWPCWSTVHGFAELATHGPLRALPADDVRRLAKHAVATIIAGLVR